MDGKTELLADFNHRVKCKTLALRMKIKVKDPNQPLSCRKDYYNFNGKMYSRLRIALQSNGCSLALCTMCPIPNEAADPHVLKITAENYIEQVKGALAKYPHQEIISIYNENFFSECEMPQTARQEILHLVKESGCQYLIVGAHSVFITREKLQEVKDILGERTKLIVGIGLQSADDAIREICIRTPLSKDVFLKAHRLIHEFGYSTKCYILLKPPFLLQQEAIEDTVKSATWLQENGVEDITICPIRIANGTVVKDLFGKKLYAQPKLATLVECLHQLQQKGVKVRASVSSSDSPELEAIAPKGCKQCEEKILHGLKDHNNLEPVDFDKLKCAHCLEREKNEDPKQFNDLSFTERVAYWLDSNPEVLESC
jgi:hypothetical protein